MSDLGSVSVLLQVQLGLGFVLGGLGIAVGASEAFAKQLAGSPWEATLRSAAKAVNAVPVLAAFALIQVQGATPDILTSVGLLVCSAAISLGTFLAILGPIVGAQGFPKASRILSSCCAFGQVSLVFGAAPTGMQLLCATGLVRAALVVQALGAVASAVSLRPGAVAEVLADLEPAVSFAPVLAGLALVDHAAWGPAGAILLPLQPAIYGGVYAGIVLFVRVTLGSRAAASRGPEFGLRLTSGSEGHAGKQVEAVGLANAAALYLATAAGIIRVLAGSLSIEASMTGISIGWSDLLLLAAVKLVALILGVYAIDFALACTSGQEEEEEEAEEPPAEGDPINGIIAVDRPVMQAPRGRKPTIMDHLKALIAPAHTLLLALLAARLGVSDLSQYGDRDAVTSVAMAPFHYGFTLAAAAVGLQVIALLLFALAHSDMEHVPEPPFDVTGTLKWETKGTLPSRLGGGLRWVTLVLLESGLLLGCLGLGPIWWLLGGFTTVGVLYALAPPEARERAHGAAKVAGAALLACGGSSFSGVEAFLERRRQEREAAAAQRAAAVGEALAAEGREKGGAARLQGGRTAAPKQVLASEKKMAGADQEQFKQQLQQQHKVVANVGEKEKKEVAKRKRK